MTQEMELSVEEVSRKQRATMLAFVAFWGIFQATRVVEDFTDEGNHLRPGFFLALIGVQFLSWLGWMICMVRIVFMERKLKSRPALAAFLTDELYQQTRLRAIMVAFFCTVGCQAALIFASFAWRLTAREGADITILVAMTSFNGVFLWLERE